MKRAIEKELERWKSKQGRLPVILRGARQVGKSYIVEKFGNRHFEQTLVINFEMRPDYEKCFDLLDPQHIISKLEAINRVSIVPGKTLLFFDEIQVCPRAIMALRYFKEKMPELHVIAAGSLLEFALEEEEFSFPVGRVQFLYMYPLSFAEFLHALGYEKLYELIEKSTIQNPLSDVLHKEAIELVRLYLAIGGMPAVVRKYLETKSYIECEEEKQVLLDTFRRDFGKYASKAQIKYLQVMFQMGPRLVAKHFKYSKVSQEMRSRDLKVALEQLCWAGLLTRVFRTTASGIPLSFEVDEEKFKIIFLDAGLLQQANQIDIQELLNKEITLIHEGALAEQFVGQELLSNHRFYQERHLYFWQGETKGSTSEVDYVVNIDSKVIPIEVKAGKTGRLRSLRRFMELKNCTLGIRVSQVPVYQENGVLSVPFYMVDQLPRLIKKC